MYVYVIQNIVGDFQYVGMSKDPSLRLLDHNRGKVRSTKLNAPWKVIYKEKLENREHAREREKYLKSAAGRRFRKTLI